MLTEEKDIHKNESSDSIPSLTLRVSEALPKDVGRGIARLDPEDMKRLGVGLGEIIEITGKKSTVAKVLPTYQDDRGKNIIQIDGIIRDNAQTGIDDKVQIRKIDAHPANKIVLSSMTLLGARPEEEHSRYIGRLMEGMPIMAGDRVRATLFGSKIQDFKVDSTIPDGAVIISSRTLIRIKEEDAKGEGAPARSGKVTYEDIGGLHKEIQRVREMIELPLRYPQIFDRLGIDAPKGVLLLGPPGCGKTLIARAVANETDAYFLSVSGPEVIHKFYGESEAKLRQIFDQAAKNAPAIVFIDEIDSIAPKREKVIGDVEKRVVAQLLALMDGLKDRGQLIVIAATNIPNALDPALRRPGRFDREIAIGIPDKFGRLEILEIHTRGMPLSDDVNLGRLAEITHGYVGADLEALCREAAMVALRRIIPNIDFSLASIPYEALLELQVTMDNFMRAFAEIEPSTTREVFTEIPDVKWNDIGGLESIKQELQEAVEWPLKYSDAFEHTNITPPRGILLHGAPGTGKTMLAKAVATESEANFISIKGPELITKWVGESEQGVREVFKKARQAAPCILFLDELDAMAPSRSGGAGDSHVSERVVSQLLTEMDGIEDMRGVVVLAATNRLDMIDKALLRPGRFDLLLELPVPDEAARRAIFEVHTKNKPIADDIDLDRLVKETDGRVGSDIELICRRAAMLAIREFLQNKDNLSNGKPDYSSIKIRMDHFVKAMEILKRET
ncbi:CDC48 family AAA ATPase [Candidatus Poribacteria bacterium]|nr:CDC48 family AAA ATPase [Candidatus Poribacteria bacterium]